MEKKFPIYERTVIAQLMAMTSGGIDAYSYLTHGHVFASMQTGNLILLGVNIIDGKFSVILNYLLPILTYCLADAITKWFQFHFPNESRIDRQSLILTFEMLVFLIVAIIGDIVPLNITILMISFAISAQFVEFSSLHGMPVNTLMMSGNIKKVGMLTVDGIVNKKPKSIRRAQRSLLLILAFFVGIIVSAAAVRILDRQAILFEVLILLIALIVIHLNNKK
ncbi:YoaK family protein [Companilactobacillus baiquanensis]|uniref:YoaK family protein n=1 Tax=Companilactobacillus baiquanensis TaxID=2486005 RepID=A0ABW1UYH2_9LACO|nr:YoaK family protein [Companilactobacillus baiquanensis]